ncbi:TetR/AcrR family transcriptional regulator [Kineococcus radiotolerans]|uniref:TetR/AcrR family transcriptional regulator n=1 Tax=Kineococcus radiotolerans TaxID=131568 RepID=UPI00003A3B69|nr:hypothetical protein [Kineococcus radiotolerans]
MFWRTRYAGTTMDAVAATGLGRGGLYGACGDERELFHRVLEECCASAAGGVERGLAGADEQAFERLTAFLLVTASASADSARRGCFLAEGAAELTEHDGVVLERSRQTLEQLPRTAQRDATSPRVSLGSSRMPHPRRGAPAAAAPGPARAPDVFGPAASEPTSRRRRRLSPPASSSPAGDSPAWGERRCAFAAPFLTI